MKINSLATVFTMLLLSLFLTPSVQASNNEASSFNPTEPEVQLGDIKNVSIVESGEVKLDTKSSQSVFTDKTTDKLVIIDGVKGKDKIYYILDKQSQDIISIHATNKKVVGADGSEVQINEVDELIGNNGIADKDGFKSNLVPVTIPKTGLPQGYSTQLQTVIALFGIMFVCLGILFRNNRKEQEKSISE